MLVAQAGVHHKFVGRQSIFNLTQENRKHDVFWYMYQIMANLCMIRVRG